MYIYITIDKNYYSFCISKRPATRSRMRGVDSPARDNGEASRKKRQYKKRKCKTPQLVNEDVTTGSTSAARTTGFNSLVVANHQDCAEDEGLYTFRRRKFSQYYKVSSHQLLFHSQNTWAWMQPDIIHAPLESLTVSSLSKSLHFAYNQTYRY